MRGKEARATAASSANLDLSWALSAKPQVVPFELSPTATSE